MPTPESNANYITVRFWIQKTKVIQKRKYYKIDELYSYFQIEVDYNKSISLRSFTIFVNKCVNTLDNFLKVEIGYRESRYIMICDNDNRSFLNCIRKSQRNRKGKIVPHPLGQIIQNTTQTPNNCSTLSNANSSETNLVLSNSKSAQ